MITRAQIKIIRMVSELDLDPIAPETTTIVDNLVSKNNRKENIVKLIVSSNPPQAQYHTDFPYPYIHPYSKCPVIQKL
jgi:hypothetical protein